MQQGGGGTAAAAAAAAGGDAGDAVMARWLQSAGLQHLASPMASSDNRLLPNLLMQVTDRFLIFGTSCIIKGLKMFLSL